jgi:replicative DNA helicase
MSFEKRLPRSVYTLISIAEEGAALGAALLDPRQALELLQNANPDDFAYSAHRLIFGAMRRLDLPLECATLAGELQRSGEFERAGGWAYITELDMGVVTERPMSGRLHRLRELAHLRRLVRLGEELVGAPYLPGANSLEIAGMIVEELSSWRTTGRCCDDRSHTN